MNNLKPEQPVPVVPTGLMALGVALILCGVLIAFFVAQEVLSTYTALQDNAFIKTLIDQLNGADLFTLGDESFAITGQGAMIVACTLFIFFALLGIHIAVALIRAGTQILSPAFPYEIARLRLRIDSLREKVISKSI